MPDDSASGKGYSVTLTVEQKAIITVEGSRRQTTSREKYRFRLLPDRGFLPERVERLKTEIPSNPNPLDGPVGFEQVTTSWAEVEPGVWIPLTVVTQHPGTERQVTHIAVKEVRVGAQADVPERVVFPDGTHVTDEIAHTKYRAGALTSMDKSVGGIVYQIRELQDQAGSTESGVVDASSGTQQSRSETGGTPQSVPVAGPIGGLVAVVLAVVGLLLWRSRCRKGCH